MGASLGLRKQITSAMGRGHPGVVMPTILGIILVMALVALGLSQATRLRVKELALREARVRAYFLARQGLARAQYQMAEDWAKGRARRSKADGRWQTVPAKGGLVRFSVQDERGKINVNRLSPLVLNKVIKAMGLDDQQANAAAEGILDWVDRDGIPRSQGAEKDFYLNLQFPYVNRNSTIVNPGELTQIRGVGPYLAFGSGPGDPESEYPAGEGLWSLVTCYTPMRKVDVNTAPLKVLMSLPGVTAKKAKRLIDERKRQPFRGVHQVGKILGSQNYRLAVGWLTVGPGRVYTIYAQAEAFGAKAKRTLMAVVRVPRRGAPAMLYWIDDMGGLWAGDAAPTARGREPGAG